MDLSLSAYVSLRVSSDRDTHTEREETIFVVHSQLVCTFSRSFPYDFYANRTSGT